MPLQGRDSVRRMDGVSFHCIKGKQAITGETMLKLEKQKLMMSNQYRVLCSCCGLQIKCTVAGTDSRNQDFLHRSPFLKPAASFPSKHKPGSQDTKDMAFCSGAVF